FCSEMATDCCRLASNLFRRQSGVDVRKDLEDLVEAGDFKDVLDAFLNVGEREFPVVFLNILHPFNENCQAGAVDVSDLGKIDNHRPWLFSDHRTQRFGDLRRNMEVDLALKLQYVWSRSF